jgi:hypothetical protein
MTLIYNPYSNQFVYLPTENQSASQSDNPPPATPDPSNSCDRSVLQNSELEELLPAKQAAHDADPEIDNPPLAAIPAPIRNIGRPFSPNDELKELLQAKQNAHRSSIWSIYKWEVITAVSGWLGITIYYLHYPVNFSLIGLFFYLCCDVIALFGLHFGLTLADLCFDSRDRSYLITLKLYSYKYEILRANPWSAYLEGRGLFFRELSSNSINRFPQLRCLFREKYSYDNIYISSDFNDRRRKRGQQSNPAQALLREIARNPTTRMRWKYGNPRFQEFIEKFGYHQQISRRSVYLSLSLLFFILIPSEDGIFLALLALIGINIQTTILFALLFGFAHFWRYSTLNCLRIAFSAILTIVFILPQYGLLTCIIGHILYDLFCLSEVIYDLVRAAHSSQQDRSHRGDLDLEN